MKLFHDLTLFSNGIARGVSAQYNNVEVVSASVQQRNTEVASVLDYVRNAIGIGVSDQETNNISLVCGPGYRVVSYLGVSKKAGNAASLGVSGTASLAAEEEDPDEAASGLAASEETPRPMAFLTWSETRATSAFLCWIEALATSTSLYWAETPRAMTFLKGSRS